MRLTELDVSLLSYQSNRTYNRVDSLDEAAGVIFQCPKCAEGKERTGDKRAFVGVHYVVCWFVGKVPNCLNPGPGRWTPSGNGLYNLTLTPSISLDKSCGWHGYVTNGEANA